MRFAIALGLALASDVLRAEADVLGWASRRVIR